MSNYSMNVIYSHVYSCIEKTWKESNYEREITIDNQITHLNGPTRYQCYGACIVYISKIIFEAN